MIETSYLSHHETLIVVIKFSDDDFSSEFEPINFHTL